MSVCCRYFFHIPTDMAPIFSHTYRYLLTGSLMWAQLDAYAIEYDWWSDFARRHKATTSSIRCRSKFSEGYSYFQISLESEVLLSLVQKDLEESIPNRIIRSNKMIILFGILGSMENHRQTPKFAFVFVYTIPGRTRLNNTWIENTHDVAIDVKIQKASNIVHQEEIRGAE